MKTKRFKNQIQPHVRQIKMLIKVPEYKHSTIESTLDGSLRSKGIVLGVPQDIVTLDSDKPVVVRTAKRDSFEATYQKWLEGDVYEKHKRGISSRRLSGYLNDPAAFFEIIYLEKGDLESGNFSGVGMMFHRGRLTSLEDVTPHDLAQAPNQFYDMNVSPETFAMYDCQATYLRTTLEDKLNRMMPKLSETVQQISKTDPQRKIKLLQAALDAAEGEDIGTEHVGLRNLLKGAYAEPVPVSAAELSYLVEMNDIHNPFFAFLRSQGIKPRSRDIVKMFIEYMLPTSQS